MRDKTVAKALGWFGIGLGLAEVLAPRATARAAGLEKHSDLIQWFGLREIVSGVAILTSDDPERWLWARVAGDGLDGALLAEGLLSDNPERGRTLAATLAVAPIVLLDFVYALRR